MTEQRKKIIAELAAKNGTPMFGGGPRNHKGKVFKNFGKKVARKVQPYFAWKPISQIREIIKKKCLIWVPVLT